MHSISGRLCALCAAVVSVGLVSVASADVFQMGSGLTSLETVFVGDPGNAGEASGWAASGYGESRTCGGVSYEYRIGKYEVTAGQYTEFLNAVAATDEYDLYNPQMWDTVNGCKIQRTGTAGGYAYSVASDYANRPVNYVSWGDSARFANWLHNGQRASGREDIHTTEDGAYALNGLTDQAALLSVRRDDDWRWAVTSENEWYKAAYYNPATGRYSDFATGTDTTPSNDLTDPTDPGNHATYLRKYYLNGLLQNDFTVGDPYYRTEVGAHENSASAYGTFDQSGNVYEWNESILTDNRIPSTRCARGGAYNDIPWMMEASNRHLSSYNTPVGESASIGFRVSQVPEPGSLAVLALGAVGLLRRRKGR